MEDRRTTVVGGVLKDRRCGIGLVGGASHGCFGGDTATELEIGKFGGDGGSSQQYDSCRSGLVPVFSPPYQTPFGASQLFSVLISPANDNVPLWSVRQNSA